MTPMSDDEKRYIKEQLVAGEKQFERLIEASKDGPVQVERLVHDLTEEQAKWTLFFVVNFERKRLDQMAKARGN